LIYFKSKVSDKEIALRKDLNIKLVADMLQSGDPGFDALTAAIGLPDYTGRRVNFPGNIHHTVGYWEASRSESNGAIKEKWLLVGYDENKTIQDLVWASSDAKDIKAYSDATEQKMSGTAAAGFLPPLKATDLDTGTRIDAAQVDALLRTNPANVKDIVKLIGKPNALGVKTFKSGDSLNLSNWSFMKVDVKGEERDYAPPNATEEQRKQIRESTFTVISIEQSRLMVSHTPEGEIKELLWTYPTR